MTASLKTRLALISVLVAAGSGGALAGSPLGTWIDHTGRGGVEITECGGALCGKVVWVKSAADKEGCNVQILGNVKPVSSNKWDGGWIFDPERNEKYDVELTPVGDNKLKVLGYMGMKMFGESMVWTRAPAGLQRCGQQAAAVTPVVSPSAGRAAPLAPSESAASATVDPAPAPAPAPSSDVAATQQPATPADTEPAPPAEKREAKSKQKMCSFSVPELGKVSVPCDTAAKIAAWLR